MKAFYHAVPHRVKLEAGMRVQGSVTRRGKPAPYGDGVGHRCRARLQRANRANRTIHANQTNRAEQRTQSALMAR
jgi:hypothetical protein